MSEIRFGVIVEWAILIGLNCCILDRNGRPEIEHGAKGFQGS